MILMNVCLGLNPYCIGRWSRTGALALRQVSMGAVLILIVLEDGLVHEDFS